MPTLPPPAAPRNARLVRRLVLLCAIGLGIAASLPRATPPVHASVLVAQAASEGAADKQPGAGPEADGASTPGAAPGTSPEPDVTAPQRGTPRARGHVTIDGHGVVIDRGNEHIRISGDRDFDSFDQFVQQAPWLAGLVFLALILLFVVPLLIVVLLIWYKIRKTRMQNETMIKLAERGVVPPPEAIDTIAARVPPGVAPSAVPLYEHARQLRRQAAWSDLRKGVVLIAIGIAFLAYSLINEGNPGWVGLICLFLGLGYVVLWILEDRSAPVRRDAGPPPAGGA